MTEENAITLPSGLKFVEIKEGTGASPKTGQLVEVHYTGWLENGKKFDSSKDRGQTFEFPIGKGRQGAGNVIPPDATLIFEVELIGIS